MLNQINSSEKNIVFLMLDKRLFFHTRSSGIPFHSTESAVVDHSVGVVMLMVEVLLENSAVSFFKNFGRVRLRI
jgi:hypothetical protein